MMNFLFLSSGRVESCSSGTGTISDRHSHSTLDDIFVHDVPVHVEYLRRIFNV